MLLAFFAPRSRTGHRRLRVGANIVAPITTGRAAVMAHWKLVFNRLMVSTVWVVIMTGLGGFLGAIAGALIELTLQALLGFGSADQIIPAVILAGSGGAFLWAMHVAIVHRQVARKAPSRVA
jgi:hypothetical protein